MKGKIALEEHFATAEYLGDVKRFSIRRRRWTGLTTSHSQISTKRRWVVPMQQNYLTWICRRRKGYERL